MNVANYIDVDSIPCQEQELKSEHVIFHDGWYYSTLESTDPKGDIPPAGTASAPQGISLHVPEGWEIVPNGIQVESVLKAATFSTRCLAAADGKVFPTREDIKDCPSSVQQFSYQEKANQCVIADGKVRTLLRHKGGYEDVCDDKRYHIKFNDDRMYSGSVFELQEGKSLQSGVDALLLPFVREGTAMTALINQGKDSFICVAGKGEGAEANTRAMSTSFSTDARHGLMWYLHEMNVAPSGTGRRDTYFPILKGSGLQSDNVFTGTKSHAFCVGPINYDTNECVEIKVEGSKSGKAMDDIDFIGLRKEDGETNGNDIEALHKDVVTSSLLNGPVGIRVCPVCTAGTTALQANVLASVFVALFTLVFVTYQ